MAPRAKSLLLQFLLVLVVGCSAAVAYTSASTISIQEDDADADLCCTSGNSVNTLTQNSGTVTCLNYTDNMNCTWLIVPQNGLAPISFEVSEISTEECCDHLTAFDGPAADFPVLLEVSGTNFGFPVHSSESYLTVVFTSDGSNSGGNFTFSYSSGACLANNFLTPQTFAITDGKGYGTAYPPNLDCQWVINSTEPVEQITFYFEKLDLDPSSTVTITDAIDGSVIGIYSNNSHVDPIVVNAPNANVEFRSGPNGGASGHQGFNLTYTAGSCEPWVNYQSLNGSFTDGSGTLDYFNNLNCSFLITPSNFDSRNLITISVPFIDIEVDDHVNIYDGPDASYELLASYSGTVASVPVFASSGSAFVQFLSDGSVSYDGFVAEYTTNSCLNQTYWYAASATFEDGSGPAFNYTAGVQCSWNILPFDPVVNLTTLYFTHLDLGVGDSINIYSADTGALVDVVKGNASTLDQILVEGGNVTVVLNSVTGGKGFNLAYAAGSCLPHVVFTSNNGTFTAGQGEGAEYYNNLDCQFVIQPTSLGVPQRSNNQRLGIVFDFVDTEQGDDYVTIYDGPSPSFPQIAQLTGSLEKQGPYFAKEGVLTVVFHSDGSNGGLGFQAVYSVD